MVVWLPQGRPQSSKPLRREVSSLFNPSLSTNGAAFATTTIIVFFFCGRLAVSCPRTPPHCIAGAEMSAAADGAPPIKGADELRQTRRAAEEWETDRPISIFLSFSLSTWPATTAAFPLRIKSGTLHTRIEGPMRRRTVSL